MMHQTRFTEVGPVKDKPRHRPSGFLCLGIAAFIGIVAWADGSIPIQKKWLMVISAVVFFLCGLQLVTDARGRISSLMTGTVCTLFSLLGFFAAWTDEPVAGGIPLIPPAWNQAFGHGLFGLGAMICAALAVSFFIRAVKAGRVR